MKKCTRCGVEKPLSEFHANGIRNGKPEYHGKCRLCFAEYEREKLEADPEKKERRREYVRQHAKAKGYAKKRWAKYREQNPKRPKLTEEEKRQRQLEHQRRWHEKNRDYQKRREAVDPEARKKNQHHKAVNKHKRRGAMVGRHTLAEWQALKAQHNHTCVCCGKAEPEVQLTRDHIVPLSKGGTNNIDNIQPLCRSCNSRKWTKEIKYQ